MSENFEFEIEMHLNIEIIGYYFSGERVGSNFRSHTSRSITLEPVFLQRFELASESGMFASLQYMNKLRAYILMFLSNHHLLGIQTYILVSIFIDNCFT